MKFALHEVRKILLCSLLFQMLIVTQITSANASPATLVKVEPHSNSAAVGETFTINITLTNVQNLFGIEVTLYWDASILQIVGADVRLGLESHPDGILHEIPDTAPIYIYKNETIQEEGKYILMASSSAPAASFNGSGNIVRITFNVTNVGSCNLHLKTKLASKPPLGGVSTSIAHTTIDGFFGQKSQEQPIWPYAIIIVVVVIIAVATITMMHRKRATKKG